MVQSAYCACVGANEIPINGRKPITARTADTRNTQRVGALSFMNVPLIIFVVHGFVIPRGLLKKQAIFEKLLGLHCASDDKLGQVREVADVGIL